MTGKRTRTTFVFIWQTSLKRFLWFVLYLLRFTFLIDQSLHEFTYCITYTDSGNLFLIHLQGMRYGANNIVHIIWSVEIFLGELKTYRHRYTSIRFSWLEKPTFHILAPIYEYCERGDQTHFPSVIFYYKYKRTFPEFLVLV